MALYAYTGRDQLGRERRGVLEGASERDVRDALRRRGILTTAVRAERRRRRSRTRVPREELARITGQLANMLEAGLPLGRCLVILEHDSEDASTRRLVKTIGDDVGAGSPLSTALAKFPWIFSEFYIGLVVAGERSGTLDQTLARVAKQLEADEDLRRRVRGALSYPAIVSVMGLLVITLLVARVVPVFETAYGQMGATLPVPTRMLLALSRFLRTHGILLAALLPVVALAGRRFLASPAGRRLKDAIVLGLPMIGGVMRMIVVHRFVSTLATMLKSGVVTLEAFAVAERVAASYRLSKVVDRIRDHVRRGEGIAGAISSSRLFPHYVASMVAVGEETGELDEMLERTARALDKDIDHRMKKLLVRLEPTVTTAMAVLVGFVVMGLYLPMFDLLGKIGR